LLQVNVLFNTVSIEDSDGGVMVAKIFVRPDCDVFVVLITGIIVRSPGKGISVIGGTRFVFQ
jgi:hypothetical protein